MNSLKHAFTGKLLHAMQNITGLQFSADSDSCFQFIFHLVVDSSDDFADEFEGQSPKLSPLPLQTVRANQSLTHHSAKTPSHRQSHEPPGQEAAGFLHQ